MSYFYPITPASFGVAMVIVAAWFIGIIKFADWCDYKFKHSEYGVLLYIILTAIILSLL